ncbi:low-affinity Zn(2+) transporter zrt2 [Saxophila tyrrhenica]|uniref:Low-affinity Zn(2+) transporter zrt2 n=1 Tax=Saxophila tyrrhenica TaxID=1690608 RepID=A0AAV9NXU0_9PEZI|nr:low-affinity Zn(2+) transporter zrt2 [Saxophila tyrrhenica]
MSTCGTAAKYDGKIGIRISAIFVIFAGSLLGAWFPVFASRHKGAGLPSWAHFVAKYFGSGVIVATAFIHLLAPASEALRDPCLTGVITEYPWVEGICLMSIFALFFVELMIMRYAKFETGHGHGHGAHLEPASHSHGQPTPDEKTIHSTESGIALQDTGSGSSPPVEPDIESQHRQTEHHALPTAEPYAAQLTGVFILEFGVVFHSIFLGLTLAAAGKEFYTLYVVLSFHQTFEGIALGSRLASIPWPKSRRWTPYMLAVGYAVSTPIALAIGLGVRETLDTGSQSGLITNGVFDSIAAGILIYTGLIELMAHDFLFSEHMQCAPVRKLLGAFGTMCCGAFLMALLGKWA